MNTKKWQLTATNAVLHFLVDGVCVCCLYMLSDVFSVSSLIGVFMTYNVLAFLTQPLTGMLADRFFPRHAVLLGLSAALLSAGVACASAFVWAGSGALWQLIVVAVLTGLGNSLFHVWGGKLTAVATGNDARALGTFVSTGALGLAVGVLLHSWWLLYAMLAAIVVISVKIMILPPRHRDGTSHSVALCGATWMTWVVVLLLMGLVMLRSMVGEVFSADIVRGSLTVLVIGAVAMAGKMMGGWLVRWMGIVAAFALVVVAVVVLLLFRSGGQGVLWAGLLAVNLTMAMTLYLANAAMPGREGLAFGLLAATLMPGYMLAQFGTTASEAMPGILLTLVPTIVLELLVLWLLREKRADVLWAAVVVNMLTNIPLNLYVTYVSGSFGTILTAELLIVVVEALWYMYFVRSVRTAFIYSVLANGVSYFTGLLVQMLYLYIM
ncbi:MAG: hypothetical protein IJT98_04675 [Prevotella sp.]|nr:hypothetical protein [Prevotella sp.]